MVKLEDIKLAFEFINYGFLGENEAYINIQTGEIYLYSIYTENEKELPEDIKDENKYIAIPYKHELNLGKNLVFQFVYQYLPEEAEKIESIFRRKGAYSKFKHILQRKGQIDQWYTYEREAQEKALRKWCKANGIKPDD